MREALAVSLLISLTVGVAVGMALLLLAPLPPDMGTSSRSFGLLELAGALGLAGFVSAPVSVPLGLVGGRIAWWAPCRPGEHVPTARWLANGAGVGAAVGGVGASLYSSLFNGIASTATLLFLLIGLVAGALSGFLTGSWCARYAKRHRGAGAVAHAP